MATSIKHIENTEKEIRKARKHFDFRIKLETLHDKMEDEFDLNLFDYYQ